MKNILEMRKCSGKTEEEKIIKFSLYVFVCQSGGDAGGVAW